MSAKSLIQIPIWKGNRIIDLKHVANIQQSIQNQVTLLDSGYKTIQYTEYDQNNNAIKKTYIIDGQHRLSVVSSYFENSPDAPDFYVTVTQMKVPCEADVIDYFNKINNVKPIQFEEDPNIIVNKYIQALSIEFNKNILMLRSGSTKRPYLSIDKFRNILCKRAHELKNIPVDKFIKKCQEINEILLSKINGIRSEKVTKDDKLIDKMLQLDFALAWDDKFRWIDTLLTNYVRTNGY
jgi:hypothetical protein